MKFHITNILWYDPLMIFNCVALYKLMQELVKEFEPSIWYLIGNASINQLYTLITMFLPKAEVRAHANNTMYIFRDNGLKCNSEYYIQ